MSLKNIPFVLKNEPPYRLKQVYSFLYQNFITDWDEALSLPKTLRETLKQQCPLDIHAQLYISEKDNSAKALITLDDKSQIETVLMRHKENHNTVCVSCQVGCGMNCAFCATGKAGLKRNLTSEEIILQILFFARLLRKDNQHITNVVFMGMGEPLANYENVMEAVHLLNDADAFNISARKISVSTCGLVPGIKKLMNEDVPMNLALSLHAPNDELRQSIMPINAQYPIKQTLAAVRDYIEKKGRKVMIEYILLKGINDQPSHAKELAQLLKHELKNLFMINLIVYNTTEGIYRAPLSKDILRFKKTLESLGVTVTQRFRLGHDIQGACGQLAANVGSKS